MGNIKSRYKKNKNYQIPNRYFLDNIAIDLDQIIAIQIGQNYHISGPSRYLIYQLEDGIYYQGRESDDFDLIDKRLSLAQSALNRWKIYQMMNVENNTENNENLL